MGKSVFWFRRDLRLNDNHGLFKALSESKEVIPIFIFDKNILDELPDHDPRVTFIYDQVMLLKNALVDHGSDLLIKYGFPEQVWQNLIAKRKFTKVYTNHDYEPYAIQRDKEIQSLLNTKGISLHTYKDHVIFEKKEILSNTGGVYTVFTPYKRKWLEHFKGLHDQNRALTSSVYPSENHLDAAAQLTRSRVPSLSSMGFVKSEMDFPSKEVKRSIIKNYGERRDYPGYEDSTSKLGIHFRFGTISIRNKVVRAQKLSDTFLSELIWRDFYAQILYNFPHVVSQAFRAKYDRIPWRENEEDFDRWCTGQTGYPIVDAGMRELNATGYMHNRVRMITASFLTKHLLLDWRKGEAYFAAKLLDYDLASNNGGWQWASGSGTDAAPYFRIFNPTSQMQKFDKEKVYIKKWIPEYGTASYSLPMVDHKFARERCLSTYKAALNSQ